jgi:hypothetical protein
VNTSYLDVLEAMPCWIFDHERGHHYVAQAARPPIEVEFHLAQGFLFCGQRYVF